MGMVSHDGPVLIEDADRVPYDEAELFGMLNQCLQQQRAVLLTARAEPGNWPYATDDVNSRVRLAAHFRLNPPTDIELSQMFVKLFSDRQVSVDPKVIAVGATTPYQTIEDLVAKFRTIRGGKPIDDDSLLIG